MTGGNLQLNLGLSLFEGAPLSARGRAWTLSVNVELDTP